MAEHNDQPEALISAAAGGLGHAFAVRLAREGMRTGEPGDLGGVLAFRSSNASG